MAGANIPEEAKVRSRGNSEKLQDDSSLKPNAEKSIIKKENVFSVRIRDLDSQSLFIELSPPFFKTISLVKFSPSGRLLLVANENC